MRRFFRWLLGLHELSLIQQTLNVIQGKLLDQEKHIFTLQSKIDTLALQKESQEKVIKDVAQVVRGDIYQIQKRFSKLEETLKSTLILPEENDIEKQTTDDGVDITDDMKVPIVSGMKVRFETEGLETEIPIL